jgi:hypothetical protein
MNRIRSRLTYANVISTIALFLALTGGAVYAASKIRSGDIAANAIKSKQLAPKAVKPSDMATPVQFVAKATGGSASFTNSAADYPLHGKTTWTQGPSEVDQFFIEVKGSATSASSGGGFPTICFASVTIKVDDIPVASAGVFGSTQQTTTSTGVLLDTGNKDKRKMTASLQSSNCDPNSHVDSVMVRGVGTG